MKKGLLYSAVAAMFCLGSCSQDDFGPVLENGDGNVTFTVQLNDKPASRAFGDGLSATTLKYAVYDVTEENNSALAGEGTAAFAANSLSTTVSLNLVPERNYKVAFFASSSIGENDVYNFDASAKTVTVDYSKTNTVAAQTVDYDCFYNTVDILSTDIGKSKTVTLTRPVAQINIGTADMTNAAVGVVYGANAENLHTTISTKGYNTLSLLDGAVTGEVAVVTPTAVQPLSEGFPVVNTDNPYSYLLCSYVLVPQEETTVKDVTISLYKDASTKHADIPVSNVPLQQNYRTNIYGNLLTTASDITVNKDNNWNGAYDVKVWDGSVAEVPEADENNVITLSTPAQFAGLAQAVNSGNSYAGKTIKLANDINLNNINWTPIGTDSHPLNAKFDGQGHTIYNLTINMTGTAGYGGFFGLVKNSSITNVKLDGVNIDVQSATGKSKNVGGLVANAYICPVSKVSVKNVYIKSYRRSGGIIGQIYGSVTDCEAENVTIEMKMDSSNDNGDKAGAIAGQTNEGTYHHTNNKVKNVKISGFRDLGGVFGMVNYSAKISHNYAEDVIITVVDGDKVDPDGHTADFFEGVVGELGVSKTGITVTVGENNSFKNFTLVDKNGSETFTESGTLTPTATN